MAFEDKVDDLMGPLPELTETVFGTDPREPPKLEDKPPSPLPSPRAALTDKRDHLKPHKSSKPKHQNPRKNPAPAPAPAPSPHPHHGGLYWIPGNFTPPHYAQPAAGYLIPAPAPPFAHAPTGHMPAPAPTGHMPAPAPPLAHAPASHIPAPTGHMPAHGPHAVVIPLDDSIKKELQRLKDDPEFLQIIKRIAQLNNVFTGVTPFKP